MNIQNQILYNDDYCIAIHKPPLIPSQPDTTGDTSLIQYAEIHFKQALFLINRLDRVASGIVLLAKTTEAAAALSTQFQNKTTKKIYFAVVENEPSQTQDTLIHFLRKNAQSNSSKALDKEEISTKKAELKYTIVGKSDRYCLLKVQLSTGRHHQIRAQLSKIGCPIKGDVKYGARRSNPNRAIHLHAFQLEFTHPQTGKKVSVEAPPPSDDTLWEYFSDIIKKESLPLSILG
jgi:23S rRNA pseudouridine1911/1915/1917 synthase